MTQEIALNPSSETNRMSFTSFLWQNLWKIKDFVKICLNLCGLRTLKWYQIYQKIFDQRNKILVLISSYSISLHLATECNLSFKGRLRGTIFKSAETVHLIMLCYQGDAIRCALSADLKMVARNHLLSSFHLKESGCVLHVLSLRFMSKNQIISFFASQKWQRIAHGEMAQKKGRWEYFATFFKGSREGRGRSSLRDSQTEGVG